MGEKNSLPIEVVMVLDELAGVYTTVEQKPVHTFDGTEIIISGGGTDRSGGSWTERDYKVEVPGRRVSTRINVCADPASPEKYQKLVVKRGERRWDLASDRRPPKWARQALGVLGVDATAKQP